MKIKKEYIKKKYVLIFIIFLILYIIAGIWKFHKPISIDELEWQTYTNNEAGFSISYPKEFLRLPFKIQNGETGKKIYARFAFPSRRWFTVESNTADYSVSRDWHWGEANGYVKKGGSYFLVGQYNLLKVEPKIFWGFNNNNDNALILFSSDFDSKRYEDFYIPGFLAILNNPTTSFSAIGIEVNSSDIEVKNVPTDDEVKVLERMIHSITF